MLHFLSGWKIFIQNLCLLKRTQCTIKKKVANSAYDLVHGYVLKLNLVETPERDLVVFVPECIYGLVGWHDAVVTCFKMPSHSTEWWESFSSSPCTPAGI